MRRPLVALLVLVLMCGAAFAQNKNAAKPRKPKMPPVDCTTVDDVTLAKNVSERIAAAPSLKDQTITATADGGVVTLTGKVKTGSNKGTATRVAKAVKCVKSVTNKLDVEMKTAVSRGNKNGAAASKKKSNKNM